MKDILDALPLTGADIGRFYAPLGVKDQEGWGRKWAAKMQTHGVIKKSGGLWHRVMNAAKTLYEPWLAAAMTPVRDYKAPHAYRGTQPRCVSR